MRSTASGSSRRIRQRLAAACTSLVVCAAQAGSFSFGLFGDMPYRESDEPLVAQMIEQMDQQALAFVIHVGDIKRGALPCTRSLFENRRALFARSLHPMVVIPGDNESVDCRALGKGQLAAAASLAALRSLFHASEQSLGQRRMPLERQSEEARFAEFREHARWLKGEVLFLTLNVVGSNNGLGKDSESTEEFDAREAAVAAWLSSSFQVARAQKAKAVVVAIHANPFVEPSIMSRSKNGFAGFLAALAAEAATFGAPVLLLHGDTHWFRVDQPLKNPATGEPVANLKRVETFGWPFMHWLRINVDTSTPEVFSVTTGQ